jgi:molybdenum cofactor cytidylyltransferase
MIAAIVLAAGGSTRMGKPKMLLPYSRGTLLSATVEPLLSAGLDRVVVVLGDRADEVREGADLPERARLRVVVNEGWREGMASSLKRGLAECREADAVLVALGDQPGLTRERLRKVVGAFHPGAPLVVPVHEGIPAHPVLFARSLFPELEALSGDVGARQVVRRHWNEAVRLEVDPLPDVDTPEDYRRLIEESRVAPPSPRPSPPRGERGD